MPVVQQLPSRAQFFDVQNGLLVPAAGYFVDTFVSGTTTPQATYSDAAGNVLNTNPLVLSADGRADVFLTLGQTYTFRLRRTAALGGGTVYTNNDISGIAAASAGSFLPLAGGTLTGQVILAGNASALRGAVPKQQLDSAISGITAAVLLAVGTPVPVGAVSMWPLSTPPAGYIEANGTPISRTTFAALFAVYGTTFGVGNGTTTFGVPNLRGEFVRGWDNGRGVDAGRALASSQLDAVQNIVGYLGTDDRVVNAAAGAFASNTSTRADALAAGAPLQDTTAQGQDGLTCYAKFDASLVVRTATETRARNVALMYIIKT